MLYFDTDFAYAFGNSLDTAMIEISGPVKNSILNSFFQQGLTHSLSQNLGLGDITEGFFFLGLVILASGRHVHKGKASFVRLGHIIHHRHIEVLQGFVDTDTRPLGCADNPFSDSKVPDFST
jgi:hypothetical protein